VSNKNN